MAEDIIPAKAPLPERTPKAAPKLKATKLTVKAATIFCIISCEEILLFCFSII
jgi:hypothetical protein